MKSIVCLSVLAVLVAFVLAQPVAEEPKELKDAEPIDMEADQTEIDSEGPADVEEAVAQLIHQETIKDVAAPESHSRQKRATCRCYRRSLKVLVCYCR